MQISNPFMEGSVAFQNFKNDVKANSHLTIEQLKVVHKKLIAKADDFLNLTIKQRDSLHKEARAVKAVLSSKEINQNVKYLVIFELDGFYGEIHPIPNTHKLYEKLFNRCYFLDHLKDGEGNFRPESDFSEDQLMEIVRSVYQASHIHLVDSIEAIKTLSDDKTYQRRLVDGFCENH